MRSKLWRLRRTTMESRTLLFDAQEVVPDSLRAIGRDHRSMVLRCTGASGICPQCQRLSRRVHSRYRRKLAMPCFSALSADSVKSVATRIDFSSRDVNGIGASATMTPREKRPY